MKLLRIKWELIMVIAFGILTIISFSVYQTTCKDWRMLSITLTSLFCFIALIVAYKEVKEFRKEVEDLYK